MSIKQEENEKLKDYLERFNAATLEVKDFNKSIAMSALKQGLWSGHLSFILDKNFLRSYVDYLACARKYVQVEESHFLHQKEERKKESEKKMACEEETYI